MYTSCTRSFISSISRVSRQTVTIILIFIVPLSFSPYVPSDSQQLRFSGVEGTPLLRCHTNKSHHFLFTNRTILFFVGVLAILRGSFKAFIAPFSFFFKLTFRPLLRHQLCPYYLPVLLLTMPSLL